VVPLSADDVSTAPGLGDVSICLRSALAAGGVAESALDATTTAVLKADLAFSTRPLSWPWWRG
jgi:hypothetical protein